MWRMKWLFIAVLLVCRGAGAAEQVVYVPEAPEFVVGPAIQSMSWSPTGQYLLAVRKRDAQDRPERTLVLWNAARRESRPLLRTARDTAFWDVQWLPRSNTALVTIPAADHSTSEVWRVDARRAAAMKLGDVASATFMVVSPTQPAAAVFGVENGNAFAQRITPEAIGPETPLHEPMVEPVGWSEDGTIFYLPHSAPPDKEDEPPLLRTFNLATGAVGLAKAPDTYGGAPAPEPPFHLEQTVLRTPGLDGRAAPLPWAKPLRPLWLTQPDAPAGKRIRLAADADEFTVSPRHDAVAWWNDTGGFVTPLVRKPATVVKETEDTATRNDLIERGQQLAAAFAMYADDSDGNLPGADGNPLKAIAPYVFDESILGDFHYTFGGGNVASLKNADATPIGYFSGPGGRAVVYADGHVIWQEDKR